MTDTIKQIAVLLSILVVGVPVSVHAARVGLKEYAYHCEIREENRGRDLGNKVAAEWLASHDVKLYKDAQAATEDCVKWSGVEKTLVQKADGLHWSPHYSGYYWSVNKAMKRAGGK